MNDRKTILRHIETSVDVDEWAVVGVKKNFDKLEKIEQIVNEEMQIMESDLLWKIKEVLENGENI